MSLLEKEIVYKGDLFELRSKVVFSEKSNSIRIFEKAHRPPGVRMLFRKGDKILLSREFRTELMDWDYRLPGGKVFDDFSSYSNVLFNEVKLYQKIIEAVNIESKQEVGLIPNLDTIKLLYKSIAGSSVIWDLYYFEILDFENSIFGQDLEEDERIDKPIWLSFDEVKQMCLNEKISEDRTVAVLLRYILK